METNFYFLKEEWQEFYQRSHKAEQLVITDPRTSLTYARMALELAVNWMYRHDPDLDFPYDKSLNSLMKQHEFKQEISHKLYTDIDIVRKTGNLAIHNKDVSSVDSEKVITNLYYFAKWFAKSYTSADLGDIGMFDYSILPATGKESLNKRELDALKKKLDAESAEYQHKLHESAEQYKKLLEENELLRKQLNKEREQIASNKAQAVSEDNSSHPRDEKETRKYLIDVLLREAGWNMQENDVTEYKIDTQPENIGEQCIEYIDYVLWGDNGKPLAIVEAKKTLENATTGEKQALLYAEYMEKNFGIRPIIFYTNGYETFLWDDMFYKSSRQVNGFYTKHELETLLHRRNYRKDIRKYKVDLRIADRPFQIRSIHNVAEHFTGNDKHTGKLIGTNRRALLVFASGAGKTRTAIALSKILFEANWAKRILFLADRTSLVRQAKANFEKYLPGYKTVNLLEAEEQNSCLVFSTYQAMIGLIDNVRDGNERFYGVGHFDLLIIDEAHRSIYRKYKAIFYNFDALHLGFTATPKDNIDQSTYDVFQLSDKTPTDSYSFDEAVSNGHLCPYQSIEVPTKFLTQGIKYEDLSYDEKEIFEDEILEGEEAVGNEWVSPKVLNNWLFNKDTAIITLRYILEHGIRKHSTDEIGKTIVFAKNLKHAYFLRDMFLEIDRELFGNKYVQVITKNEPKAEEFVERFCDDTTERLPQIAISVDMMDTGIDAPSVVNLVFYKPVKSYSKFWQMIGRGSRLRPNLFGKGKDKKYFQIFDLCGNFEFFKENPKGIKSSVQKNLSEIIFTMKLQLAQFLKHKNFVNNSELQAFRTALLDECFHDIASLNTNRFDVHMKLQYVHEFGTTNRELWNYLDKKDIHTIEDNLAHLVLPKKDDDDLALYYDKLLYSLMVKRIKASDSNQFIKECAVPISKITSIAKKLLKKTTIPEIQQKNELILQPLNEAFWKKEELFHLENIRSGIRNLVKYIDPTDQKYVTTDFDDAIIEDKIKMQGFFFGKED